MIVHWVNLGRNCPFKNSVQFVLSLGCEADFMDQCIVQGPQAVAWSGIFRNASGAPRALATRVALLLARSHEARLPRGQALYCIHRGGGQRGSEKKAKAKAGQRQPRRPLR